MYTMFSLLTIVLIFCVCGQQPKNVPRFEVVKDWPEIPENVKMDGTTGVAVDAQDNVYILHRGTPPILQFSREGKLIRGFGEDIVKSGAHGIRLAADNTIWLTDIEEHVVMQISTDGKILTTLGTRGKPGESDTQFNKPTDIAFTASGDVFITDGYGNTRVVKFDNKYQFQFAWGDSGTGSGQFNLPHAAVLDSEGRLYVCDRANSRIQIFTPLGEFIAMWTEIGQPWGIAITKNDEIFVSDGLNNKAMLLNTNGEIITSWGKKGTAPGEFDLAHGIAVDSHGDVYVTEITNKRIQKFARQM